MHPQNIFICQAERKRAAFTAVVHEILSYALHANRSKIIQA